MRPVLPVRQPMQKRRAGNIQPGVCYARFARSGGPRYPSLGRRDLVGDDREFDQLHRAKIGRHRDIATARHHNAADPRMVLTRIEGVPAPVQTDLEPDAEIHRRGIDRRADIAEIAGAITRRPDSQAQSITKRDAVAGEIKSQAATMPSISQRAAVLARIGTARERALVPVYPDRLATTERPDHTGGLVPELLQALDDG
jgi:hypothetical protein